MNHHLPIVPVVLILVLLVTSMCFVAAIAPIEIPVFRTPPSPVLSHQWLRGLSSESPDEAQECRGLPEQLGVFCCFFLLIHSFIHSYIYIYMCVCVYRGPGFVGLVLRIAGGPSTPCKSRPLTPRPRSSPAVPQKFECRCTSKTSKPEALFRVARVHTLKANSAPRDDGRFRS